MKRAVVAVAAVSLALPAVAAQAASSPWSGYRIGPAATADGGFVGARLTDGKVTYRLDALARRTTARYGRVHRVLGDRRTSRAAWILAKYGDLRVADQSAAVDVATYALLSGMPVNGRRERARLRSTGRSTEIRALAETMLAKSRLYAGPYTLTVATKPGLVGGKVSVRVAVTSYAGRPVAHLPVLLQLPGIAERHVTSATGEVAATFPAEEVGLRTVRVRVSLVPEWRLAVREPGRAGASRIAVAGRKAALAVRAVVAVRAEPTVAVAFPPAAEVGKPQSTTFTVSSSEGSAARTVTAGLFGPFDRSTTPTCTGSPAASGTVEINGDGAYTTPVLTVAGAGLYFWGVQVGDNQLNAPASSCGGTVRVRSTPTLALDARPGLKLGFTVGGLAFGYSSTATATMYGPYPTRATATCRAARRVGSASVAVTGNGTYRSTRVTATKAGWYAWRVALPAGYFSLQVTSRCGAKGSFVKVD